MALKPPTRPGTLGRWLAGRRTQRWLLAGLVALVVVAGLDTWHWQGLRRLNGAIAAAATSAAPAAVALAPVTTASRAAPPGDGTAPALRFAQAHALATQGHAEVALRHYAPLLADPLLGPPARFNTANLLLRQGQALQAGTQAGQALALIELAKEHYRSLLRNDPGFWPARYNLERAQRLVADPDGVDEPPGAPAPPAERSATTMRAYSPGLP